MEPTPAEAALNARIGAAIRRLRERSGLSMRELARRASISQPFLSQLEHGTSAPSMITTYRLAEALGVQPGALLPAPGTSPVHITRAAEGRLIPVAPRPDAALGRALLMRGDTPLEIIEYQVKPGEYLREWFTSPGDLALYVITGTVDVEVEGTGTHRLHPRDLLTHDASIRHRWTLASDAPAHLLLTIAHPRPTP
ncbi:helix-turn-helix domain-containing protein [Actinomadura flavalba]|uniref:helix-turn-helix domain-containing protein n=1 Tax=Actinomadura flavalba TaxID=1120938 RepID=UPI0003614D3F|nr:XRE family transcriptional regulator [Actinomadura flavalba]